MYHKKERKAKINVQKEKETEIKIDYNKSLSGITRLKLLVVTYARTYADTT